MNEKNQIAVNYVVNELSDITAKNSDETAMDHFITDEDIMRLISNAFDDFGTEWYNDNEADRDTFCPKPYPECACEFLGYPKAVEPPEINAMAPGFNPGKSQG